MTNSDLTICTVTFKGKWCLDLNWALVDSLNPGQQYRWIVVENSGPEDEGRVAADDARFDVVPGGPPLKPGKYRASYHHATAMQKALPLVRSRYLLILDPDFFVVRPKWIRDVLSYMDSEGLAFFGAPHDPGRPNKYRYFPSVVFMLIDLQQVEKAEVDLMPQLEEVEALRHVRTSNLLKWGVLGDRAAAATQPDLRTEIVRHVLRSRLMLKLFGWHEAWGMLGKSRDTGYAVYERFGKRAEYTRACLTPVWDNPLFSPACSPRGALARIVLRALVPDWLSLYPKRRDYSSSTGFRGFGLPDLKQLGWEEYLWRGSPFAFHVRGMFHGLRQVEPADLAGVVQAFLPTGLSPHSRTCQPTFSDAAGSSS